MAAPPSTRIECLERENAELRRELDEALAQQRATAEVLQVINSSPGDLAPVFDAMLEKAMILCDAAFGALMSYTREKVSAVATRGLPPELVDVFREPIAPRQDGDAPYARFLRGEPLQHIVDMAAADVLPSLASRPRALVEIGGARTGLEIPLRKEAALLGSIWFYRREVRPFSEKQIALVQYFAAQAVIAMENAQLITETREALERQTATAEVLRVINSSPGDLVPVFDAILQKAMELCDAAFGSFLAFDGECFHAVAHRGVPEALVDRLREPGRPTPGGAFARLVAGEAVVHLADIADDDAYRAGLRGRVAMVDIGGAHTAIWMALAKDGVLLGTLVMYRQEVRPFTDKQVALLQNFAAQAVIAMENARLLTETREALAQQTATAEVLQVINSSPGDLKPVFDALLERAMRLCEASFGYLLTYDGEHLHSAADAGHPAFAAWVRAQGPIDPEPGTSNARLVAGEDVIHIPDLTNDPDFPGNSAVRRAVIEIGGFRTMLSIALRRDDALMGVIHIYRQELRRFTDKQIALLQNFAAQAVIAMENARLITETREALDQQTATAEVLSVINSSPGDLAPVFEAILAKAHARCGAELGGLLTYDGDMFRATAFHGVPEAFRAVARGPFQPGQNNALSTLVAGAEYAHVADLAKAAAQGDGDSLSRAAVDLAGIRTILIVPLRRDAILLGAITAYRTEVQPFTDTQIALLQNFAAQAVIAMENARLLGELRQRTEEVAALNRDLEARVASQLAELERTGKLRRFLAPQLADLIVAQGDESILESHRREIVVVFCDLRGFTAFAERAEPEEVMTLLKEYHAVLGPIVARFEGTLDHYAGDGVMVFFNDPLPTPEPARRAIEMAAAMRGAAQALLREWRRHGHDVGFGVGIAQGYATLGQIGFAERMDYTAIGTVTNLAARLCDEAKDGQILVSGRIAVAVEDAVALEEIGDLSLKGLSQPIRVHNVPQ